MPQVKNARTSFHLSPHLNLGQAGVVVVGAGVDLVYDHLDAGHLAGDQRQSQSVVAAGGGVAANQARR